MKLFHTSDWHLGRMLYGRSLLADQRRFLEEDFLPAIKREKPACVLLAGDIYDRQIAPAEAIRLFDETLSALMEIGCRVCAISGNHDGADRIAIGKGALKKSGVYLSTTLAEAMRPVTIEENGEKAQIFLLPYFDTAQAREFLDDEALRGENACMEKLIEKMLPLFEPGAAHILVAHCFAAGAATSDSESDMFVGGSGEVAPRLFEPFDYVALGHLHGPQRAGEKARYSGSPMKYSVDEEKQRKGFCRVLWNGCTINTEHVEIAPKRDVRRISGLFKELMASGEESICEDYVEIVLEDKAPVFSAADRLRPYYPNMLAVSNPWAVSGVSGQRAAQLRGKDDLTVFSAFLKDICGVEADECDRTLFGEILEEVRK